MFVNWFSNFDLGKKKRKPHQKKQTNPRINWCVFKDGAQSWLPNKASKAHTVKIWMCTSHCYRRKANPMQRAWLIWKTWNLFNVWWNMICKAFSYFCHCRLYQFYMLTKVWPRDIFHSLKKRKKKILFHLFCSSLLFGVGGEWLGRCGRDVHQSRLLTCYGL